MAKVTITIEDNSEGVADAVCFVEAKTEWVPENGYSKAVMLAAGLMNLLDQLMKEEEEEIKPGGTD